ncbi:MAG: glycosyltransferase, partial [Brucella intermedia]
MEDAIAILALLPEHFLLTVAGDGPALPRLKVRAQEMGLDNRVEWLGSIDDIARFYEQIDYYLFMSWYEGFGLSVAEAMAIGRPVVGLLGDGEIAEPEYPLVTSENSLLVPRSSPGKFANEADSTKIRELRDAILQLDQDKSRLESMIDNSRNWVRKRFSSQIYGERIHAMYASMISDKAGRA